MSKRDFLAITDLTRDEILRLFDLGHRMKAGAYRETPLAGKTLAMIFAKSSTRTRVSFEVGTYQLGGQALFLSSRDIQIGRGEPIPDTARVLSRYVDGIMIRTFDHAEVEELARHASIPVINGLTDLSHPCQVLADLFTVREALGTWEGKRIAWVGDGNNMANSWIEAAQVLGFELRLACPEGYEPNRRLFDRAKGDGACVSITRVPETHAPSPLARSKRRRFGSYPSGHASRSSNPSTWAASIQLFAMLLPSPIHAIRLPSHPPTASRTVKRSASTWHGCDRSVRPLITGMVAWLASCSTSPWSNVRIMMPST